MPKTETGRQALVKTLRLIMASPESTIDQKLEACQILANLNIKFKRPSREQKAGGASPKLKDKSGLLG